MSSFTVNIFWFRRDLRIHDNAGLFHALSSNLPVLPIFIFDKNILNATENRKDKRVNFIFQKVRNLKAKIEEANGQMEVYFGFPKAVFAHLTKRYTIHSVFANEDYEPYARKRDERVRELLKTFDICFLTYKDQLIFSPSEILKDNGAPYTVYTPFSRKWKAKLTFRHYKAYDSEQLFIHHKLLQDTPSKMPSMKEMGFWESDESYPEQNIPEEIINNYDKTRDFPGLKGTSRLGLHLRFGTMSIREIVDKAIKCNRVFLNELIWREFFQMIIWHFPQVVTNCFKPKYETIPWRNKEEEFKMWCEGKTGYPIVDAGMRQLNSTGFMHNRVRMVVASFLTKHLLIDWRWGEAYFAQNLLDYELASNNGNWQWIAGTGCDAAPYFRIFNPMTQAKKFDKTGSYIKKWIPELETPDYQPPMVDHRAARERALMVYKKALQ